jgi:hypothetical protein
MAEQGTQVTRRTLLQNSWRTAVVAGVAAMCRPLGLASLTRIRLADATAETFAPYLNRQIEFKTPATLSAGSSQVGLELVEIDRHEGIARIDSQNPAVRGKRARASFSLLFESAGRELPEGLHRIAHRDFAETEMLLTRVSRAKQDGTIYYEAIFG